MAPSREKVHLAPRILYRAKADNNRLLDHLVGDG